MGIFFTSDHHFFHKNVIEYNHRPFSCVEEMNHHLIQAYNEKVTQEDTVYFLGDFSFCSLDKSMSILDQLNGRKHLVRGNHDHNGVCKLSHWESVDIIKDLWVDKQRVILCHYPMWVWPGMHRGAWHLYGHVHGSHNNPQPKSFDVGVDTSKNFGPYSYDDIAHLFVGGD